MIVDVCARIKSLSEGVTDGVTTIKTAFDPPPPNLNSADLPAQVTFTGESKRDLELLGQNKVVVVRMYRVQVAVMPIAQGNPRERESLIRPLIEAHIAAFDAHPTLNKLAGVRNAEVVYDSGVRILMEYGAKYIGYELGLQVVTVEPRIIAKGE